MLKELLQQTPIRPLTDMAGYFLQQWFASSGSEALDMHTIINIPSSFRFN